MFPALYETVREYREGHLSGTFRVLEIGSRNVNGSVRDLFGGTDYHGIDAQAGEGVDTVLDIESENVHSLENLIKMIQWADTVLLLETLEHVREFWKIIWLMNIYLPHGSFLVISTPTTGFPLHRYPKDYYRFMEDTYRELFFSDYEILDMRTILTEHGHPVIVALGRKK